MLYARTLYSRASWGEFRHTISRPVAPAPGKVGEYGARSPRLYDVSLDCRGGAGRARSWRTALVRLREHSSRHGFALLVAGCGRAWRGSGDDHQDPRLARRAWWYRREGDAFLQHRRGSGPCDT